MNMLDLMNKMTQLSEAKEKTKTGLKHTAEPGGYGRKDDEDDEGNKVKSTAVKKGKGRPKKDADDSGETKKYDFSAFGVKSGKDVKLPKHDKKKTTVVKGKSQSHAANKKDDGTGDEEPKAKKKGLKEYFDSLDKALNEAEQIQIKPASQMPKQPGQTSMGQKPAMPGQPQQVAGQPAQNTQVIAQGNKTLGTVNNPQLAQQIKQSIGKGEMTLMPDQMHEDEMDEGIADWAKEKYHDYKMGSEIRKAGKATMRGNTAAAAAANMAAGTHGDKVLSTRYKSTGSTMNKQSSHLPGGEQDATNIARLKQQGLGEEDMGKHNNATTGFDALVRKLTPKYGAEAAKRIAGAQLKKIREADQPPNDSLMSPMSEARAKADDKAEKAGKKVTKDLEYDMKHKGKDDNKAEKAGKKVTKDIEYDEKKKTVKEAAKPDFLDLDKDGNKKEPMKKAATDKKKVKEGMEHKLKAARHTGKAHALSKQAYNCNYDDMEESRHYHEGFKEGLDECYGQMPIQGYVGEANNEVADMASYGAHTPQIADEGNAFTAALKKTPSGGKFSVGGKTFTDRSSIEESPFAFEAWEKELNSILEGKEVTEGMTVSISKGQQGTPDSVSVSAQDSEADQLLSIIKQSGLGLFGGDDAGQPQANQPMTVDGGEAPQADIAVVDDHDDMLSLIRKMTGQGPAQASGDYEEEGGEEMHGHEHGEEETCNECGGMMEEGHACGEAVEEDESMDQREYEVAEEINPNNNDEAEEEQTDATRDAALATAAGKNFADTDAPLEEGGDGGEAGTDAIAADDAADEVNAEEEDLDESYANGDDDTFETDIDFMTKVISGGLNKQKSTGQTTIPVVSTQVNRLGSPMRESTDLLTDWRKLSGIK
jgi:hypothetical protein